MVGLVVGLGSYGEYVITLGGELLRERRLVHIFTVSLQLSQF